MSGLKIIKHNGVISAGCTVKLFGSRLATYVYVVDGLLIDTGPSKFTRQYIDFFKSQHLELAALTHFHEDHSGNAFWLDKQGIEVYIHPSSISICQEKAKIPFYRRLFWGKREKFSPRVLGDTLETKTKKWQVIEAPGHSFDHVAFYDRQIGALFTGDLFVTPKTKLIMSSENIPQIIRSLRSLQQFDFQTLYCGHAGVVEKGKEMLAKKLAYLVELTGEVQELHSKGWSIKAINKKIFPQNAPLTYISSNEWASEHIIRSIIKNRPPCR